MGCVVVVEEGSSTSHMRRKVTGPTNGCYAIDGNPEAESSDFNRSCFMKAAEDSQVVVQGVCNVPNWCEHGSCFIYENNEDTWLELNWEEKRVTCVWQRIDSLQR